jgi:hypothetical protein
VCAHTCSNSFLCTTAIGVSSYLLKQLPIYVSLDYYTTAIGVCPHTCSNSFLLYYCYRCVLIPTQTASLSSSRLLRLLYYYMYYCYRCVSSYLLKQLPSRPRASLAKSARCMYVGWEATALSRDALTLLLYCCFTAALLLLYCCFTVYRWGGRRQRSRDETMAVLLYCRFTAALLLLYCI